MSHYGMAPPAGSLLARQVLVVRQKLKLVELRNEYAVLDQSGRQIGAVVQATQSPLAFLARVFTSWDVTLPITLHILGPGATPELVVHKPWFTWRCQVLRPDGPFREVGAGDPGSPPGPGECVQPEVAPQVEQVLAGDVADLVDQQRGAGHGGARRWRPGEVGPGVGSPNPGSATLAG